MKKLATIALLCAAIRVARAQEADVLRFHLPFGDRRLIEVSLEEIMRTAVEAPPDSPDTMTDEEYETIKAELFTLWNWGPEEIEWFNRAYGTVGAPTVNGTQEDYILAAYEIYQQTNGE